LTVIERFFTETYAKHLGYIFKAPMRIAEKAPILRLSKARARANTLEEYAIP